MKILVLLISLCLSAASMAASKNIILNLDGTLVQGIPKRNFDRFTNKDQMFSVTLNSQTKYFYIIPYASQLLQALNSKKDVVLHIASKYNKADTLAILGKIKLPTNSGGTLATILSKNPGSVVLSQEDMDAGKIDLTKITNDLNSAVLFTTYTDIVKPEQKSNEIIMGKPYFFFESYEQAEAELKANDKLAASIPANKKEWSLDQAKLALVWQILVEANYLQTPGLLKSVSTLKISVEKFTKSGQEWAEAGFMEFFPKWKFSLDKKSVTGCAEWSLKGKSFSRELTLQDCLDYYGTKFSFRVDDKLKTVTGCEELDEASSAYVQSASLKDCVDNNEGMIRYYWEGKTRSKCVGYLRETYFYAETLASSCTDEHVINEGGKIRFTSLFFDGKNYVEGIPEIMKLSAGGVVPASVYGKYDSIMIGQALIRFIQQSREKNNSSVSKPAYDFYRDTRILMAINSDLFEKIKTNGFLNQHQTNTSKGTLSQSMRFDAENTFLGINLENPYGAGGSAVNKVRPKYSYLVLDAPHDGMGDSSITGQYGNIFFKFKESVKSRSTFTPGDSLYLKVITGLPYGGVQTFNYRSSSVLTMKVANYWETQIWGELKLSDVEYVLVNCPAFSPLSTGQIQNIKTEKLKVYQCLTVSNGSNIVNLTKGTEL